MVPDLRRRQGPGGAFSAAGDGLDVSLTVLIGLILLIGIAVKNDEAAAIRAAGLFYANLPVAGAADLNRESVDAFDQLLRGTQGPTLVHCASGNRVGAMAALRAAWLQGADEEAAIAKGRRWGLRGLEGEVREQLARER